MLVYVMFGLGMVADGSVESGALLPPAERQALIDDGLDLASRFTTRTSDRS